jgi:hypothetical protein
VEAAHGKTLTTQNGGWGKKTHQPTNNNHYARKTWPDVVRTGGINVQIVLGNGNLGLTTPRKMRGERRGGAARRLGKKSEVGERGVTSRGKDGPEMISGSGNKGGKKDKQGGGRVKEREEPSTAAYLQTGHLDLTMRDGI